MAEMRTITYKDAVREAMCEEMRSDNTVFLMGEDMRCFRCIQGNAGRVWSRENYRDPYF